MSIAVFVKSSGPQINTLLGHMKIWHGSSSSFSFRLCLEKLPHPS